MLTLRQPRAPMFFMTSLDGRRVVPSALGKRWGCVERSTALLAVGVWLGAACATQQSQPVAGNDGARGVSEANSTADATERASSDAVAPGAPIVSGQEGAQPELVAASKDDPAPRVAPAEPQAAFESSMEFQAGEKRGVKQGRAHKQALMRRFDTNEAGQSSGVPRSCPTSAEATTGDTHAAAASGAATSGEASSGDSSSGQHKCHPPRDFVERLCAGSYPGVALVMFSGGSPWERAYLRGESKAWTTAPGAQDQDRLARHEEVLVLQGEQQSKGGLQVISSSGASFYALRWNGSCVKLTEEEVTRQVPWNKGVAPPLDWSYLDDNLQDALKANDAIKQASIARKKECRGARMGNKPPTCAKLDKKLNDLIVAHLRGGTALPDPTLLP